MLKCPNCNSINILKLQNNSGTYKYNFCNICGCKFKYTKENEIKIINEGKTVLCE